MITNFSLDSFRITDTRSRHEDTDFVTVSITVGTNAAITKTRAVGNVNNGTHPVGLGVSAAIPQGVDVPVVFSYAILNKGHGDHTEVQHGVEGVLSSLGTAAAKVATTAAGQEVGVLLGSAIGTAAVPIVGTAMGALAGWVVVKLGAFWSILFADCDGVVAIGIHVYSSKQLVQATAGGHKIIDTVEHLGKDSPHGCGANSKYFTTATISTLATTATVIDLNGKWASGGVPGPVISVNGNSIAVDMSAYHRPSAHGSIVDSSDITATFPDDKTYTGKLQPPNTIRWSNNSAWTKA